MQGRIILIAGPTASGKSDLAVYLAERHNGTIINVDSLQVYDALPRLTAQPDAAARARAPHRLYGVVAAQSRYNLGDFLRDAAREIAATEAAARVPILVGGSGLYFMGLEQGIADIPSIPEEGRAALRARLAADGAAALHAELARCDPQLAARIPISDPQRILRGLEVFTHTGTPLSVWQSASAPAPLAGRAGNLIKILLLPQAPAMRRWLYARCDSRFVAMVENGAAAEVAALERRAVPREHTLWKAHGVRELQALARGEIDAATAIARAQQETRRYAKRQMTWFRNQMIAWKWFEKKYYSNNYAEIDSFISNNA